MSLGSLRNAINEWAEGKLPIGRGNRKMWHLFHSGRWCWFWGNQERRTREIRRASAMPGKVTTPANSNGSSWERPCESDWTKMETNRLKSSCSNGAHENKIIEPHRVQRRLTRTTSRTEVTFPCVRPTWCINRCPYRQWTFLRQRPLSTVNGKLQKLQARDEFKLNSNAEVIRRATLEGKFVLPHE